MKTHSGSREDPIPYHPNQKLPHQLPAALRIAFEERVNWRKILRQFPHLAYLCPIAKIRHEVNRP